MVQMMIYTGFLKKSTWVTYNKYSNVLYLMVPYTGVISLLLLPFHEAASHFVYQAAR